MYENAQKRGDTEGSLLKNVFAVSGAVSLGAAVYRWLTGPDGFLSGLPEDEERRRELQPGSSTHAGSPAATGELVPFGSPGARGGLAPQTPQQDASAQLLLQMMETLQENSRESRDGFKAMLEQTQRQNDRIVALLERVGERGGVGGEVSFSEADMEAIAGKVHRRIREDIAAEDGMAGSPFAPGGSSGVAAAADEKRAAEEREAEAAKRREEEAEKEREREILEAKKGDAERAVGVRRR